MKLWDFNYLIYRFLEALTNRRREQQEKLAEKAIEDAARKKSEELAAAAAAAQQNGVAASAPVTPATTPVATNSYITKEGYLLIVDLWKFCQIFPENRVMFKWKIGKILSLNEANPSFFFCRFSIIRLCV